MELVDCHLAMQALRITMVRQSSPLPYLPDDIVVEILLKLSVKDLLRFKSVCKQWKILISDNYFIKKHLLLSVKNPKLSSVNVILNWVRKNGRDAGGLTVLGSLFGQRQRRRCLHALGQLVGSCNGLVCIIEKRNMVLWNPSIGRCEKLLTLDIEVRNPFYTVYGFAYDSSNDDYKIVKISKYGVHFEQIVAKVFSLKANCWRCLPKFPRQWEFFPKRGIYLNGSLHWMGMNSAGKTIISLDLATEKFKEVHFPAMEYVNHLGVVGGCLSVMRSCGDIWLLRDFVGKKYWIPMVPKYSDDSQRTPEEEIIILELRHHLWTPVEVKTILELRRKLFSYHVESNIFKQAPPSNCFESRYGIVFVESLISPNSLRQ